FAQERSQIDLSPQAWRGDASGDAEQFLRLNMTGPAAAHWLPTTGLRLSHARPKKARTKPPYTAAPITARSATAVSLRSRGMLPTRAIPGADASHSATASTAPAAASLTAENLRRSSTANRPARRANHATRTKLIHAPMAVASARPTCASGP